MPGARAQLRAARGLQTWEDSRSESDSGSGLGGKSPVHGDEPRAHRRAGPDQDIMRSRSNRALTYG